jgi:hypothetical protein
MRNLRDMKKMLCKRTAVSIGAPLLGNRKRCSFSRAFERRGKFLYVGKFLYEEFERYEKNSL